MTTIAQDGKPRRLAAVPDTDALQDAADSALEHATELSGLWTRYLVQQAASKPTLRPAARLDVEQARKFVLELDTAAASASPLLAMFLLGRCAEHAQALLDILDTVVAA